MICLSERVRVAVVDDQYLARGFFEGLVRMSERYELAASIPCAEQAITFCDQNPVDLVVMDVMMKHGLDGLTCARSIKASHPEVKIILTTSTAEAEWIEKARRARVESFWFKEYSATSLTEVMDRTMDGESVYPDSLPNPEFGIARKAGSDRAGAGGAAGADPQLHQRRDCPAAAHLRQHRAQSYPAHAGKNRL